MSPLTLLLLALAAPPRTAVADLSVRPEPALAEALRALPDLAGAPLPAQKAAMVVADAAKLGIVCSINDARCLQKILVLARVDELIAFEVSGRSLSIARVTARTATFAKTRKAGRPGSNARSAWAALERAAEAQRPPPDEDGAADPEEEEPQPKDGDEDDAEADPGDEPLPRRRAPLEETATASSQGVTVPLVVAGSAAGATVLLGAATLGVSAVVANQVRATERDVPLDESYDAMNATFWTLTGLTAVAGATTVVATILFLLDDGAAADPLSAP